MLKLNQNKLEERVDIFNRGEKTKSIRIAAVKYFNHRNSRAELKFKTATIELLNTINKSDKSVALFSDEVLLGHRVFTEKHDFVDIAKFVLPLLEEALKPHTSRFIFYIRPFDDWLKSAHNQGVKALRYKEGFEEWRSMYKGPKDWDIIHDDIQSCCSSPVEFIKHETKPVGFLGHELLQKCGFKPNELQNIQLPKRRNESLPEGALEFMLSMNRSDLDGKAHLLVQRKIRSLRALFR